MPVSKMLPLSLSSRLIGILQAETPEPPCNTYTGFSKSISSSHIHTFKANLKHISYTWNCRFKRVMTKEKDVIVEKLPLYLEFSLLPQGEKLADSTFLIPLANNHVLPGARKKQNPLCQGPRRSSDFLEHCLPQPTCPWGCVAVQQTLLMPLMPVCKKKVLDEMCAGGIQRKR